MRTELRVHAGLHAVEAPSDGARGPLLLREFGALLAFAATGAADLCRRQLRRHGGKLGGVLGAKKEVGADQGVDIWRPAASWQARAALPPLRQMPPSRQCLLACLQGL